MVILHIVTNLTTGGAELMLKRLVLQHAAGTSYRHIIISLREKATVGPQLEALGVPVESLGLGSAADMPRVLWQLKRRIEELQPDIVQTWMYHSDLLGGVAARLAGFRKIIWGVRTTNIALAGVPLSTLLIRRLCARLSAWVPSRILYVAEAARNLHEQLGYDAAKSIVIQNGYTLPAPAEIDDARTRRRAELGLAPETILVGSAGRFSAEKGYDSFVGAAQILAERYPQARFLLIGREVTWENTKLADWIRTAGLTDRFTLLGERRDIHEWLAAMDVFILCSLFEGFPNIVAEAMSARVPCVVTNVGDAALLVGEARNVVEPGDIKGLAETAGRLISGGPAVRAVVGAAARERVESTFSIDKIARRYEELYASLVTSG